MQEILIKIGPPKKYPIKSIRVLRMLITIASATRQLPYYEVPTKAIKTIVTIKSIALEKKITFS